MSSPVNHWMNDITDLSIGLGQALLHWLNATPSRYFLLIIPLYPLLCNSLRYRRLRTTLRQYPYTTRASFSTMTDEHARHIQTDLAELEFPFTFEKALQFALFRTYGIPKVSRLLVSTSELSASTTASKRYSDTVILVQEFVAHSPTSQRSREAIARMNYIHSIYQKSGKITNTDMLYTLALFACEPVRWINIYEWRKLEAFEVCAIGTFWKSLGDAMGIDYSPLGGGVGEWKDGLEWWDDVKEWCVRYEEDYMIPADTNHTTAEETVNILLWSVPKPLRGLGRHAVSSLMDERLRRAMIYPDPPAIFPYFIAFALGLRKLVIRYFFLPRPYFLRNHAISIDPTPEGTYFALKYDAAPYYIRPTTWQRWSPNAWYLWSMGLPLPGDEGDKYHPAGYRITDVGPRGMDGKGGEYIEDTVKELQKMRTGGCPFSRG